MRWEVGMTMMKAKTSSMKVLNAWRKIFLLFMISTLYVQALNFIILVGCVATLIVN